MSSIAERKAAFERPPPPASSSSLAKPPPPKPVAKPAAAASAAPAAAAAAKPVATVTVTKPAAAVAVAVAKPVAAAVKPAVPAITKPAPAPAPVKPAPPPTSITINISEQPVKKAPVLAPLEIPPAASSGDAPSSAPATPRSLPSTPRALLELITPPTVEEQDFMALYLLSFLVPFFALRFAFELTRRLVLAPVRLAVKWTPGSNSALGFVYVKLRPVLAWAGEAARARLPGSMDYLNAVGRAGLERFLVTLSTALAAAGPHLKELAEAVARLEFRLAFAQAFELVKAWAPMLLLLIPLVTNAAVVTKDGLVWFSAFSKTAIYKPFGSFLRHGVSRFGKALSENPEVFAETISYVIGPLVMLVVVAVGVVWLLVTVGLVDYGTLSSLYVAWFFRLVGVVSEPDASLPMVVDAVGGGGAAAAALADAAGTAEAW